jgi:hypothetical protein
MEISTEMTVKFVRPDRVKASFFVVGVSRGR